MTPATITSTLMTEIAGTLLPGVSIKSTGTCFMRALSESLGFLGGKLLCKTLSHADSALIALLVRYPRHGGNCQCLACFHNTIKNMFHEGAIEVGIVLVLAFVIDTIQ